MNDISMADAIKLGVKLMMSAPVNLLFDVLVGLELKRLIGLLML